MKSLRSLGSLGALAAVCAAGTVQAAVVISTTVVNIPINSDGDTFIDVDGDLVGDISTFGNSTFISLHDISNMYAVTTTSTTFAQALHVGDTIGPALSYDTSGYLYHSSYPDESPTLNGSFYVGISFLAGDAQTHYGWILFNFPEGGTDPHIYPYNNSLAVSAAWESQANTPVTIIPEPASTAGLVATAALFLAPLFRFLRRKK